MQGKLEIHEVHWVEGLFKTSGESLDWLCCDNKLLCVRRFMLIQYTQGFSFHLKY